MTERSIIFSGPAVRAILDALIEELLHGDGIPRCDEWDRLRSLARSLERRLHAAERERDEARRERSDGKERT